MYIHIHTYIHTYIHMCTHTQTYMYICMCVCMYVCICVRMSVAGQQYPRSVWHVWVHECACVSKGACMPTT